MFHLDKEDREVIMRKRVLCGLIDVVGKNLDLQRKHVNADHVAGHETIGGSTIHAEVGIDE
jgi:hypothetical protein